MRQAANTVDNGSGEAAPAADPARRVGLQIEEAEVDLPSSKRGPSEDRGIVMDRIVNVARDSFAQHGAAGTTMRAVAITAGVDPRLVTYYFHDKTALLDACLQPPEGYVEQVRASVSGPLRSRGRAMVANMVRYWETPETAGVLRAIILTAMHEPVALERLKAVYRDSIVGALAASLDDEQRNIRANLAASQIIGACMTRYIYGFEPLASMPPEAVVDLVAPAVQKYLTSPLPPIHAPRDEGNEPHHPAAV